MRMRKVRPVPNLPQGSPVPKPRNGGGSVACKQPNVEQHHSSIMEQHSFPACVH